MDSVHAVLFDYLIKGHELSGVCCRQNGFAGRYEMKL